MPFTSAVLLTTICINALLGIIVLMQSKKDRSTLSFFMIIVSVFFWAMPLYIYSLTVDPFLALQLSKISYFAAGISTLALLNFAIYFSIPEIRGKLVYLLNFLNILAVIVLGIAVLADSLLLGFQEFGPVARIIIFGPYYPAYVVSISLMFVIGFFVLYSEYRKEEEGMRRKQFQYIFIGVFLTVIGGLITNLILPTLGIFDFYWLGPIFSLAMIAFFTISILRYHLFNTKVITTELFVFGLWIFILVQTLLSKTQSDQLANGGLLILTIITGYFLIRSVIKEVEQREYIEKLAVDLEKANGRLSEFVSFATHQIRGPLTAIKGYASLIEEGDYGEIPERMKDPIGRMSKSSQSLVVIVEDFLNVSRIEQGKMKYDYSEFDLAYLINEVVAEIKPNIDKKGLAINVDIPNEQFMINADMGKLKQVITNLIDNAVKYTPKGSIELHLEKNNETKKALFKIADTGVGISEATKAKLFQKYSRAEGASKDNILGTGLGLYIAMEMVKAHNGRLWVESPGNGKGSTFFVELDLL